MMNRSDQAMSEEMGAATQRPGRYAEQGRDHMGGMIGGAQESRQVLYGHSGPANETLGARAIKRPVASQAIHGVYEGLRAVNEQVGMLDDTLETLYGAPLPPQTKGSETKGPSIMPENLPAQLELLATALHRTAERLAHMNGRL